MTPEPGTIWQHYKGGVYKVLAVGKREGDETHTDYVVYQALAAPFTVWIRPRTEWFEWVTTGGKNRFERLVGRIL